MNSSYLVSKNKVFYVNSSGLSYFDLLTGKTEVIHKEKMSENNYLFEFDDILYYSDCSEIKKMFNIKENTLHPEFTPPLTFLDKNSKPETIPEQKPHLSDDDLARDLILKADKSHIKKSEAEDAKLYTLPGSSQKWIDLAESWNITLTGKVISFELSNNSMINQYIVEMDTARVYHIPNHYMMPAFLMENDVKVKKFDYKQ